MEECAKGELDVFEWKGWPVDGEREKKRVGGY